MARRKFEEGGANLPVGSHQPCQLVSIKTHEPSEELLKRFPDMGPSLCFRFVLYKPDDPELHKASAVRFCSDTMSKMGKLFEFTTDLRGGREPESFDEADFVGEWYRISVRKKPNSPDKLFVSTAEPVDPPADVPDGWSGAKNGPSSGQGSEDRASDGEDGESEEFPL